MSDKPILFSAPMIRALLDGRKTQTRRIIKPRKHASIFEPGKWTDSYVLNPGNADWRNRELRYEVGDVLWVKETWARVSDDGDHWIDYRATPRFPGESERRAAAWDNDPDSPDAIRWRPSIFMPREASRLTLIVEAVKVERLQDISEEDARAEGVFVPEAQYAQQGPRAPVLAYAALWDSINGACAWEANPWCVALTFRVKQRNIDATPTPENSHD